MKKIYIIAILYISIIFPISENKLFAQCSVCTKTAAQMGEKPAKALNSAIIYLMLAPFAIIGGSAYIWYKNNRNAVGENYSN